MGEIDHAQGAENQRQAERDEGVGSALVEPVQNLKKDSIHCDSSSVLSPPQRAAAGEGNKIQPVPAALAAAGTDNAKGP
ncbi:MAG: hypothetical protein Kow00114_14300 [Kiloniellaceae bacterium]